MVMADVHQGRLTWLPPVVRDAAEQDNDMRPLLDHLARIWAHPKVQQLLTAETSHEWPDSAVELPQA